MSRRTPPSKRDRSAGGSGISGGGGTTPFFGRRAELDALREAIADDRTRAVLVVGHEGMGKSALLARLIDKIHHDSEPWGAIIYQTCATDSVDTILERIIEDGYAAANTEAGSFAGTEQRKRQWAALWKAVKAIPVVKNAAEMTEAIHDLTFSLKRDVTRATRDQFIERLDDVSKRMPPHGRAVFVIDPDPEMPAKSDQLWASVLRELPENIKFVFAQRPIDALVSAESRFHELERQRHVIRVPANGLQGFDDEGWDDFLNQSALRLGLTRNILEDALAHYDRHPYCVTAAVGLIEQGDSPSDLPPDPVGIAKRQWEVATGKPNGEQAAALLQAHAILEVPAPEEVVCAVSGLKTNNALTRWRNDPFVGTLIAESSETEAHHQVYHRILSNFIRSIMGDDDAEKLCRRAIEIYRERLNAMPPDGLAARRLALHVRSVEGEDAFVTCFINECTAKLMQLGLLDEIEALTAQVVPTVQPSSKEQAALLGNLGIVMETRGDLNGAEAMYRKSLEVEEKLACLEGIAIQYGNLGDVMLTRGDLAGAEAMHRKALEIDEKLGHLKGMAIHYGNLGIVMKTRGDLDGAEAMYRKSLEIDEKLGYLEGMANQYGNLGNVMQIRGDLDGAEAMYQKALEINEKLGRLEGMATNYANLGVVMEIRGDLDSAEAMDRKALEIDKKLGRLEGMANQYGNLGNVMKTRGDLDGAEAMLRKALEINEKLGRPEGIANQYANLGNVMQIRGDVEGAEAMYRKALEINEQLGRLEGMAILYGNLGNVMFSRGDLDGAEAMYRKAIEINEKLGSLESMAIQYGNLGLLKQTRGDLDGAREMWTKSRDMFAELGAQHMVDKVQGSIDKLPV